MNSAPQPRLLSRKCSSCIFRPGNKMNLAPGRLEALEKENNEIDHGNGLKGATLTCHETLPGYGRIAPAVCRGFYDRNRDSDNYALMIADRLCGWEMVDPPDAMTEWIETTSFVGVADLETDETGLPEIEDDDE